MKPLLRVFRAPWVLLLVLLVQWLPAVWLAAIARTGAASQMGRYAFPEGGSFLAGLGELMAEGAGLAGVIRLSAPILLVLGVLVWMAVLGGVIQRLHGPISLVGAAAAGLSSLPGLVGATLWHLPLRALMGFLPFRVARKALEGPAQAPALMVVLGLLCLCVCAFDLARCRVVLSGRSGWHPLTTWHALRETFGRPAMLMQSAFWGLLQWACVVGIAWVTLQQMGGEALGWWARLLAFAGVLFGLTRMSVVIEVLSEELRRDERDVSWAVAPLPESDRRTDEEE